MPSFPNRSVIPIHRLPQIYLDSFENSQWSDPRDWVEYGKYTMRRMDRDRIEAGYVVRALVKWWGGTTARPYLWKENASDTTYRESWDDPRKPRPSQTQKQQDRPRRFIIPKKKSRGPSR